MDHETKQKNPGGSKEADYQKLAPLQQYASLQGKRTRNKETAAERQHHAGRATGQESHYKPLWLKIVNKPCK